MAFAATFVRIIRPLPPNNGSSQDVYQYNDGKNCCQGVGCFIVRGSAEAVRTPIKARDTETQILSTAWQVMGGDLCSPPMMGLIL